MMLPKDAIVNQRTENAQKQTDSRDLTFVESTHILRNYALLHPSPPCMLSLCFPSSIPSLCLALRFLVLPLLSP